MPTLLKKYACERYEMFAFRDGKSGEFFAVSLQNFRTRFPAMIGNLRILSGFDIAVLPQFGYIGGWLRLLFREVRCESPTAGRNIEMITGVLV